MEEYLTTKEVSRILKCSIRTIERRIEHGRILGVFKDERRYLIPKASVEKYISILKEKAQIEP